MVTEECQSAKDKETAKATTLDLSDEGTEDDSEKVDLNQEKPSDGIPYPLSKPNDTADLDETLPFSRGSHCCHKRAALGRSFRGRGFVHALQICEKTY